MKESKIEGGSALSSAAEKGIDARLFRTMAATVALAVVISLGFAPWRITTGLLVGGLLSLLNYHWMRTSIAAAFDRALSQAMKPKINLAKYILRYFVVVGVVGVAYKFNVVSLTATIAGLCSFVVALFVEALRQFYSAIIHREEAS